MVIGFNRDPHEKEDKLKSSELTTKQVAGRFIMGISALVIAGVGYEYTVETFIPQKVVNNSNMISVHMKGENALNFWGDDFLKELNNDLSGTIEGEVYGGKFSFVDEKTLQLRVDMSSASYKFEIPKENLMSDLYTLKKNMYGYLNRFENRIWDGQGKDLHLIVIDEHGNKLMEVGN